LVQDLLASNEAVHCFSLWECLQQTERSFFPARSCLSPKWWDLLCSVSRPHSRCRSSVFGNLYGLL